MARRTADGGLRPALSVRARLALGNALIFGLILCVLAVLLRYGAQLWLESDRDRDLAVRARRLANRPPPSPALRSALERQRQQQSASGESPAAPTFPPRALAPDGKNLFTGEPGEPPWDPATFARSLRGQSAYSFVSAQGVRARVLSVPVVRGGRTVGAVQVAASTADTEQELGRLTRLLLTLVPAAVLAALLGGRAVTARALAPVRDISRAAGRIEARDLSERLPVAGRDELGELAVTFNAMLSRLERAFERQRRFTADASHELRTPLAAIKGEVGVTLAGPARPAEEYRRALEDVAHAADRMDRIVEDLLLLARSDGRRLPMDLQLLDIAGVLRGAVRAVEGARNGGDTHDAPVRVVAPPGPLYVVGDPHHLERLFVNLLTNALHHTPAEGSVTLAAGPDPAADDRAVVTVADTGRGIAPEHLPHVFESFYRADPARSRDSGGTGLGLPIVRSIAEAHGGTVAIESEPGRGTTVTVTLPRARLDAA